MNNILSKNIPWGYIITWYVGNDDFRLISVNKFIRQRGTYWVIRCTSYHRNVSVK